MVNIQLRRYMACALTAVVLVSQTGCGKPENKESAGSPNPSVQEEIEEMTEKNEDEDEIESTEPEEAPIEDTELEAVQSGWTISELRSCMEQEEQLAGAVAYLGYREEDDASGLSDWIRQHNAELAEKLPFLMEIPEERTLGAGCGDLFCIVPRDENTSMAVNHVLWISTEDDVWPQTDEVLYRSEAADPVLLFVNYGESREEPDAEVNIIAGNGAQTHWYPRVSDYGSMILPAGYDEQAQLLDLTWVDELMMTEEIPGEEERKAAGWLPPTNEGLADTTWVCEAWSVELHYGNCDPEYAGIARLYCKLEDQEEFTLAFTGGWRMEENCLRMELSNHAGNTWGGAYPVLISQSGDELYVQKSDIGSVPPFFAEGEEAMELIHSYG